MAAPKIRKDAWGRILLLSCPDPALRGRIAIAAQCCRPWHIAVRTQGFQHPGCIELDLGGRSYLEDRLNLECESLLAFPGH